MLKHFRITVKKSDDVQDKIIKIHLIVGFKSLLVLLVDHHVRLHVEVTVIFFFKFLGRLHLILC